MDLLEPWLAATIEGELGEALRHQGDGTNRQQSIEKPQGPSYDDGSNLRIPSAKKGRVVQITKFLTFEEPIQVTLSDSVIRVNASITNQASQQYAKKNKRKLTEGTVGGLIQLHEFEIVATHLGPRDKRLTLYVKDFKSLGSDGSGNFGVAPQAIESREVTKELLNKLADLRRQRLDAHSKQSANTSPIRSQPSSQTREVENNQESQVDFATQVPRSNAPMISKPKPPHPTTSVKIGSISAANNFKSLAPPMNGKHANSVAGTLRPLQVQAAPQKPSVSGTREALLNLLRNHKRARPASEVISGPTTEQPSERTAAFIGPAVIEEENEATQDIILAHGDDDASRAPIRTQKRKRQSPDSTPRRKAPDNYDLRGIDKARREAPDDHDLHVIEKGRENLAVYRNPGNKTRSGAAVAETSISTLRSRPVSPSVSESAKSPPDASLKPSVHSILKLTSSASGQKTGRNRISSRDVNIPKDQETLLSRADSWLPAEPGQREPTANVPISLLTTLNRKADLRAQRPEKIREQRNSDRNPSAITNQTADSESDVPLSSEQWPASPKRNQLPPDSSPASAEHSDHALPGIPLDAHSILSSRRLSHASVSSHSMPSGLPSPISGRGFSGESGSPGMVSPDLLSTSVTSASAGEEVHRFKCEAPDCGKSYKNHSSLKYHVDRHHPNTESFENFNCPVKDCTKLYASPGGLEYHIEHHCDSNIAPPSLSGSATTTPPGASTSLFPGLKSRSERDGQSEGKVVGSRANNESASVEGSTSMSTSLNRGSRISKDKETVRGSSSTNSVLNSNLRPDAQPALAQSATQDPDETQRAKEPFSPLLLASPTPESDLEMTVPLALSEKTGYIGSSAPLQRFPSTAPQPQDPFTQVKHTPYVNVRVQNKVLPGSGALSSPLKASFYPLTNGTTNDDTEYVSASVASGPETSTAETHSENKSSNTLEDQGIGDVATRLAEESNSQNMTVSILEKTDELIADVQQESSKAEAAASKPDDSSFTMAETRSQSSGLNHLPVAAEANAHTQTVPEKLPTREDNHTAPLPQVPTSDHAGEIAPEMKRKVADSSFVSPSVAKRQKRFKIPSAFTFTEKSVVARDPLEGARQYRQEFLASRRSSESSTPTTSPTMPFTDFPETTSEIPRDPSERARKIRREFLASRRSSETSTPTTSPKVWLTAHTGTIQAVRQISGVEKNVEEVTVQVRSADTEIERPKMTELKKLLAKSPTQEVEFDAEPLPNGTVSIEADGDDAKPGAHHKAFFDHEAETLMFATQNADIEIPDAGQNPVIEASFHASNDEAQRAQSVELDVSFQSPDHQDAANDLANAKDGIDQIVDPGRTLMVATHDPLTNVEDGRPGHPEPDKAGNDISTRAEEVMEQGSNTPTPEIVLERVAGPVKALEPLHQQRLIEENAITPMSDKVASDPTLRQQSLTVDADSPMSDEVATEPKSEQWLIGVDKDTPMPNVQVDQGIQPSEPIAHMTNQTTPLSFAITAFVAESDRGNQIQVSPAAVNSALPPSQPMSDTEMKSVEEHRNAVRLPVEIIKQNPLSVPHNIFKKFKATYPAYPGDMKHFAALCSKISQLVKANRMEHQSLWDDFIVRHKIEYSQYLQRCAEEAEDAVPYEDFYQTKIEEPQYQKRVINRRSLDKALDLVAQKSSVEQVHVEPVKDDEPVGTKSAPKPAGSNQTVRKTSKSWVTIDLSAEILRSEAVKDDEPRVEPVKAKSALKEANYTGIVKRPSESRVTIDLTDDDSPEDQPKMTEERGIPPQLSVPHLVNGVSIEPSPLEYRRNCSGSLYQVSYTSPAMRGSHMPPPPQSIRSPLVPATAPMKSTTKSDRRSLPWKESDRNVLQNSPNATGSDSQKRYPGSELREVRAKGLSNAGFQVSAKSSSNGSKQSQDFLHICQGVIQSNWGIKAHELLEPDYNRGQVLSESMIELLAEIASKVNVREARNRIKEAIDTRIRYNARRGAGHPNQDRKMLKSDLEVVRGVVETSSMSTTSPFSLPHTNAAVEKQNEGTLSKWWDDDNSPFKSFARAYTSIRLGNGNSFAKADRAQRRDAQEVHEATNSGVQLKRIDIMRWNL